MLEQYLEWQKQGKRMFRFEADCLNHKPISVWCYDYDLCVGSMVTPPEPPPTAEEMKNKLAARLREELERLG